MLISSLDWGFGGNSDMIRIVYLKWQELINQIVKNISFFLALQSLQTTEIEMHKK